MKVDARIGEIVDITAGDGTTLAAVKIEGIVDGCVRLELDVPEKSNVEVVEADDVKLLEDMIDETVCPACGGHCGGSPLVPEARGIIRSLGHEGFDIQVSDN